MLNLGNVPYQILSNTDCQLHTNCFGVVFVTQLLHFSGPCPVEVHCACCTAFSLKGWTISGELAKEECVS